MSMLSVTYGERAANAALAPWILSYWCFSVGDIAPETPPFTVWPDGCLSVALIPDRIPTPRVMATGPRVTAMQPPLHPHSLLFGVRLWPDAIRCVTGLPARTLRDSVGPATETISTIFSPVLEELEGLRTLEEAAPILDGVLRPLSERWPLPDPQVRRVVQRIVAARGEVSMAAAAAEITLSLRQLQRRFLNETGLTMREWARVRRLRESLALRLAGASGWSQVAADAGFADHAHLTREFVALTGLSPSAAGRQLNATAHRNVNP